MANVALTAAEQLVLELVNRARLDPLGEAARFNIDLNQGLAPGTIKGTAKQPLAPNGFLVDAARAHSEWMIAHNTFSHTGTGGSDPGQRMTAAGYVFSGSFSWGENIAVRGQSGGIDLNSIAAQLDQQLFLSAGHRTNMLDGGFRELGTGLASDNFNFGNGPLPSGMLTEDFARSGTSVFVTGVAINDANGNKFYDIGEARSGISIDVGAAHGATAAAGGYAVATGGGSQTVTFSGGDLGSSVSVTVSGGASNVKVDLVGQHEVLSSATATLGAGATALGLLGVAGLDGTGNSSANTITGNKGTNGLAGLDGNDKLRGMGGADTISGGAGQDVLTGGGGRDVLRGGSEHDVFDFNAVSETGKTAATRDVIADYKHLVDSIDLKTIDANGAAAGDAAFKFIGSQSFHHVAGELRVSTSNPSGTAHDMTFVSGDTDGDGAADFQIQLTGIVTLSKADFVL